MSLICAHTDERQAMQQGKKESRSLQSWKILTDNRTKDLLNAFDMREYYWTTQAASRINFTLYHVAREQRVECSTTRESLTHFPIVLSDGEGNLMQLIIYCSIMVSLFTFQAIAWEEKRKLLSTFESCLIGSQFRCSTSSSSSSLLWPCTERKEWKDFEKTSNANLNSYVKVRPRSLVSMSINEHTTPRNVRK